MVHIDRLHFLRTSLLWQPTSLPKTLPVAKQRLHNTGVVEEAAITSLSTLSYGVRVVMASAVANGTFDHTKSLQMKGQSETAMADAFTIKSYQKNSKVRTIK